MLYYNILVTWEKYVGLLDLTLSVNVRVWTSTILYTDEALVSDHLGDLEKVILLWSWSFTSDHELKFGRF